MQKKPPVVFKAERNARAGAKADKREAKRQRREERAAEKAGRERQPEGESVEAGSPWAT